MPPELADELAADAGSPALRIVRRYLDEAGLAYTYLDIRQDPAAAARLRELANGFESVPTVVMPDGRVLVEPGTLKLRKVLQEGAPEGGEVVSAGEAVRAGLSNPVYIILALIALTLIVAVWLAN